MVDLPLERERGDPDDKRFITVEYHQQWGGALPTVTVDADGGIHITDPR